MLKVAVSQPKYESVSIAGSEKVQKSAVMLKLVIIAMSVDQIPMSEKLLLESFARLREML